VLSGRQLVKIAQMLQHPSLQMAHMQVHKCRSADTV